jgi:hypothetical protein
VDVYEVLYGTALSTGRLELSGSPPVVRHADAGPLRWRARFAAAVGVAASLASLWSVAVYRAQHPWFSQLGAGMLGLCLGLVASALLYLSAFGWLLATPARTRRNTLLPSGAAVVAASAAALTLLTSRPSLSQARDALQAGDIARAALITDAMRSIHATYDERDPLFESLRIAQLRATGDLDAQIRLASQPSWSRAGKRQAAAIVRDALNTRIAEARSRQDAQDFLRLADAINTVLPESSRPLRLEGLDIAMRQCLSSDHDVQCAVPLLDALVTQGARDLESQARGEAIARAKRLLDHALAARTHDPSATLEALDLASLHATTLHALGAPLAPPVEQHIETLRVRAREALEIAERAEHARLAKQREREARDAQRRAEREARKAREEERRAKRAEARAFASHGGGLLCNDGTLSPSCTCNGSWRGCCSWHGGVAGCE